MVSSPCSIHCRGTSSGAHSEASLQVLGPRTHSSYGWVASSWPTLFSVTHIRPYIRFVYRKGTRPWWIRRLVKLLAQLTRSDVARHFAKDALQVR